MVTEMIAEDDALFERKRNELIPIRTRYEQLYHELHPDKIVHNMEIHYLYFKLYVFILMNIKN